MAYQSESVDSKVDFHKLIPSEANLKTSERKKTKEIYIKYNAPNKILLTHDLFLFQLPLSALIIHLRSYREKTVWRFYEEHFVLPRLKIYG